MLCVTQHSLFISSIIYLLWSIPDGPTIHLKTLKYMHDYGPGAGEGQGLYSS